MYGSVYTLFQALALNCFLYFPPLNIFLVLSVDPIALHNPPSSQWTFTRSDSLSAIRRYKIYLISGLRVSGNRNALEDSNAPASVHHRQLGICVILGPFPKEDATGR